MRLRAVVSEEMIDDSVLFFIGATFIYGIHLNSAPKQTKWKENITKFAVILRMENLPAKFENPTP